MNLIQNMLLFFLLKHIHKSSLCIEKNEMGKLLNEFKSIRGIYL